MGKGENAERELVQMFWGANIPAIRIAGSGVSRFPCPDIIAGKDGKVYAIECKATKSDTKYITNTQVKELMDFASAFGAKALIGVRFNRKGWHFFDPEDLPRTKEENYVVNQKILHKALFFNDLSK